MSDIQIFMDETRDELQLLTNASLLNAKQINNTHETVMLVQEYNEAQDKVIANLEKKIDLLQNQIKLMKQMMDILAKGVELNATRRNSDSVNES